MPTKQEQSRSITAMLLVFALVGAVVLLPAYMSRVRVEMRIEKARDELGMNSSSNDSLKDVYNEVIYMRELNNSSQGRVPEQDELAQILRGLSEALTRAGVKDKELITKETKHYANYSVIPVMIEFSGQFEQAEQALQLMEEMSRLIRVDYLKISGDTRSIDSPLRITLQLSTFFSDSKRGDS